MPLNAAISSSAPSVARLKFPPLIATDASSQPLAVGIHLCERQAASFTLSKGLVLCVHIGDIMQKGARRSEHWRRPGLSFGFSF